MNSLVAPETYYSAFVRGRVNIESLRQSTTCMNRCAYCSASMQSCYSYHCPTFPSKDWVWKWARQEGERYQATSKLLSAVVCSYKMLLWKTKQCKSAIQRCSASCHQRRGYKHTPKSFDMWKTCFIFVIKCINESLLCHRKHNKMCICKVNKLSSGSCIL